ncbi:DUF418 domain-containing protein [Shewanella dokdonensis]|uniref:DUF418 domain-containing protein n=1 Tax=Shewanella dokdonensis TaxID=712036 RepID=A0ABX8DJ97_9GAMM|nr:DUF418 domain-containing protein [Shewanella dokdonensis]
MTTGRRPSRLNTIHITVSSGRQLVSPYCTRTTADHGFYGLSAAGGYLVSYTVGTCPLLSAFFKQGPLEWLWRKLAYNQEGS